jgi:hypothetical protein
LRTKNQPIFFRAKNSGDSMPERFKGVREHVRELADNSYLSEEDRQTLSGDASYLPEILERHPTIFIRPDDRTSPNRSLYVHADEQGVSNLGLIVQYGSHEMKIPPIHREPRIKMRVISREAKKISEMSDEEFSGAYEEIHDTGSAISWLRRKYPERRFTKNSIITVHKIEYV